MLRDLRPHVALLAVVEFDVPDAAVGDLEHLRFLRRTYEQGLAECTDDRTWWHGIAMNGGLVGGAVENLFHGWRLSAEDEALWERLDDAFSTTAGDERLEAAVAARLPGIGYAPR